MKDTDNAVFIIHNLTIQIRWFLDKKIDSKMT